MPYRCISIVDSPLSLMLMLVFVVVDVRRSVACLQELERYRKASERRMKESLNKSLVDGFTY